VVHGLREHLELLVLVPPAELEADVVDARPEHQPQRPEPGLADEQELVHRQVRGEQARGLAGTHLGEAAHRVFGDAQLGGVGGHERLLLRGR
jgi:hypothetical protein